MRIKRRSSLAAFAATAVMSVGAAAPASAAPQQEGLVNVNVSDVTVQVPIAAAANICDTAVNVLAQQFAFGDATCDATAESIATPGRGEAGGGSPRQEGLVNVNVSDVLVQLPISVAANVCDTTVNVLSAAIEAGDTECDAVATSQA